MAGSGDGVPVLGGVYVYPIKSCGGISLASADLGATDLLHDRRWMLVDEGGGSCPSAGTRGWP